MALRQLLDTDWMSRAACAGLGDLMVPPLEILGPERNLAYLDAIEVCDACQVRAECLAWALMDTAPIEAGVVAGLTPLQLSAARKGHVGARRANTAPKCGSERGLIIHTERGETCEYCSDRHRRRNNPNGT